MVNFMLTIFTTNWLKTADIGEIKIIIPILHMYLSRVNQVGRAKV